MHTLQKITKILLLLLIVILLGPAGLSAKDFKDKKVLVVMSYHPEYAWQQELRQGIESVLSDARIKYFYMNTKKNLAGGHAKAKEAFALYKEFLPDVVIAADDNAQSMFVAPYLKDKVKTPVIFCGVNHEAAKYGYPASNVTGVVERFHWREGLNFLKLIAPGTKKAAIIYNDTPSTLAVIDQIRDEMPEYPVEIIEFVKVNTVADLKNSVINMRAKADALLLLALAGIRDQNGTPLESEEATLLVTDIWNKPTLGQSSWQLKVGVLCAVAKTGQEQGDLAARMALDIFKGNSIQDIPITWNKNGRRMVNMTTAKKLGIKLNPSVITATEIVFSKQHR